MLKRTTFLLICLGLSLGLLGSVAHAWQAATEDEVIEPIRQHTTISPLDERHMADWVRAKVNAFLAVPERERQARFADFRNIFRDCHDASANTPEFKAQLAAQEAEVAVAEYGRSDLDPAVAHLLAQVLLDVGRMEAVPGLIAGLKSRDARVRYLCARGLAVLKGRIASDRPTFDAAVRALREAGLAETEPVALARIYQALAYPDQAASVTEAYLALLDKRLTHRCGPAIVADGAEIEAFEFFRSRGVTSSLSTDQKAELVRRLVIFLRLDAERYGSDGLAPPQPGSGSGGGEAPLDLGFYERDRLERMLVANEAILAALVPGLSVTIANQLSQGGFTQRAAILATVRGWVGDADTNAGGLLNAAPWNVPLGAPCGP